MRRNAFSNIAPGETRKAGSSEPRAAYSGGGLIRFYTYRGKRTRAKPIEIVLAFLGQCDDSLRDDVFFRSKPITVAKGTLFRTPSLEQGKGRYP